MSVHAEHAGQVNGLALGLSEVERARAFRAAKRHSIMVKVLKLVAASALLSGRREARPSDLWVMRYVWDLVEQQEVLGAIVQETIERHTAADQDRRHPRSRPGDRPDVRHLRARQPHHRAARDPAPPRAGLPSLPRCPSLRRARPSAVIALAVYIPLIISSGGNAARDPRLGSSGCSRSVRSSLGIS